MISVVEVVTARQKKAFVNYPLKLYKGCKYYVPTIIQEAKGLFDERKNPLIKDGVFKAFLCYNDGVLVGRIAGFVNQKYNQKTDKKYIRFSYLDCIDDVEVFKTLLDAVEAFGRELKMDIIHGPWGFNDTDREGVMTFGFDKRSTYATNYNYPYYESNIVKLGYSEESVWCEKEFEIPSRVPEKITKLSGLLKKKYRLKDMAESMSVREIAQKYGDGFFETLNYAYGNLDGCVPIEGQDRKNLLDGFISLVNKRYLSFLVDEEGEVASFGIVLPSIADAMIKHKGRLFPFGFVSVLKAKKHPSELEMALVGVSKRYKNSGVHAIMIERILSNMISDGVKKIESNPMLENNHAILHTWKIANSKIIKKRKTYKKEIIKN
ncbi:MAG: hypothetical protein E7369_00890 [Clostridiales bacterium]|nr:hypothetical protein [Clostridiales bacterium]